MSLSMHQKVADDVHEDELISDQDEEMPSDIDENQEKGSGSSFASGSEGTSSDTNHEIAGTKIAKSKKTLKRKRRATEPSRFGATLQFLLDTDAPSTHPLSLKPSVARKRNDEKLELKAKKVLQIEKKEKEDKGRVTDVIGGWGGESERALRKVAQRGGESARSLFRLKPTSIAVVKLFNAIQQSQAAASVAVEETKASRGSGKPSLAAPSIDKNAKGKGKNKDNIVGRGKESEWYIMSPTL
jgi:hypothetical protein